MDIYELYKFDSSEDIVNNSDNNKLKKLNKEELLKISWRRWW